MKVFLPLLAAASVAVAQDTMTPIQVIEAQLSNVINTTAILTKSILAFEGIAQAAQLLTDNTNALQAVQNGTKAILALNDQVPLADTLALPPITIQLSTLVNQSISAIIEKKPVFVNASLGSITYGSLQQLSCASDQFTNATLSRLPGGGINAVSDQITAPIKASFQLGLAAYRDNTSVPYNCTPTVNSTSRGLAKIDQNGAALLSTSNGVTVVVAAVIAGFMMI